MPNERSVRVFISYAHADDALRRRLRTHLAALEREGLVQAWDDREIRGGDEWADEIDERLNRADVVLLLVTADFIRSEYCYGKELARALQRHDDPADRAIVIPIILRACDWEHSSFARLLVLPRDGQPISEWKSEDLYFTAIAKALRRRIQQLVDPDRSWLERAGRRLRDPRWWQRPGVWPSLLVTLVLGVTGAGWWLQAAGNVQQQVAGGLQALRAGRAADAVRALEPACGRRLVGRPACFALEKARLGALLEQPEALPDEAFAARVEALKASAPNDPDLLFYSAQLALRESRSEGHAQALRDIGSAIRLADDNFPEAYFYLANLQMLAGNPVDALPLLDKAMRSLAAAPDHYLNLRAYARARSGDVAGAMQDFEQSAERGSIVSRIELAELLWRSNDFERASDQLQAAGLALGAADRPLSGRNALPWVFELGQGSTAVFRHDAEKRCYTRWMRQAGIALAGRAAPDPAPDWADCGPEAKRIAAAVAASLARAARGGMNAAARQRATEFARRHGLGSIEPAGGA